MYKKVLIILSLAAVFVIAAISVVLAYNLSGNGNGSGSANSNTAPVQADTPSADRPFQTQANSVVTLVGHEVSTYAFLVNYEHCIENDDLEAEILYPLAINWHEPSRVDLVINLVRGGRSIRELAALYILEPAPVVEVEAGMPVGFMRPQDFLRGLEAVPPGVDFHLDFDQSLSTSLTAETGRHDIQLILNDIPFTVPMRTVDTAPPAATAVNVTIPMGDEISPYDFVENIFDISHPVTAFFANNRTPDVNTPGERPVAVLLEDRYGNQSVHYAALTVLPITEPPVITGAADIHVQLGGSIMFRRGVSAEDAFGNPLELLIDSSSVDVHAVGVYPVIYSAVDSAGFRTEVTVYVHVIEVDPEDVRTRANVILERIINENMTQVEQARAIFNWITANIGYAADFDHETVYDGAHQALVHRRGDCFTFYAISEVLLTLAGVPNVGITRVGGNNRHFWNLINPDGMGWHHFDTTPIRVNINRAEFFMFTESQAQNFSYIIHRETGERNYFVFDTELAPEVVY